MKISVICGGKRAVSAAETMRNAMYDVHGTEVRIFSPDDADELYIQGGDALVLVDEGDNSAVGGWLGEKGEKLSLNGLLGAALAVDGGSADILAKLFERGTDVSADLALDGENSQEISLFGKNIAVKTAQLVGNWSLDFD